PQGQRALQSIEESLYASFETGNAATDDGIESSLLKAVYDHWLELFGALQGSGSESDRIGSERLLWQMLQALEQNVQMGLCSGMKDPRWDSLLRRLERTAGFMARGVFVGQHVAEQNIAVSRGKNPAEAVT